MGMKSPAKKKEIVKRSRPTDAELGKIDSNNGDAGKIISDLTAGHKSIEYEARDIALYDIRVNADNEIFRGVYTPLPTTWLKDQSIERSPFIVAASDTMLLVKYGEIYYTTNDIGTDGAPYSFTTCRGEYGIISVKDYLAGSQDWVQVTLQGRDLV